LTEWVICWRCGRLNPLIFSGTICGAGKLEENHRCNCFLCRTPLYELKVVGISEEALKLASEKN